MIIYIYIYILILYSLISWSSSQPTCTDLAAPHCETYGCLPPIDPSINEGCRDPSLTPDLCYCPNAGNGLPWGDCQCDGGAFIELRFKFEGVGPSTVTIWNKDRPTVAGDPICQFTNVQTNQELTCNVAGTIATEFPKNTYFDIQRNGAIVCDGTWHTSCSADIIGQFGAPVKEGLNVQCEEIKCTGWKDLGTPDADCDDGFDPCPCNSEPETTTNSNPEPPVEETCYCENAGLGLPWGDCQCDGGSFIELRFKFEGVGPSTVTIWNKDRPTVPDNVPAILCQFDNVYTGQELTCNVQGTAATEFPKNTYFNVERNGLTACDGAWHTSCSADIIGQFGAPVKEGLNILCEELICTGWKDLGTPDNDCDDGFVPCPCTTTTQPQSTEGPLSTEGPQPPGEGTAAPESETTLLRTSAAATTTGEASIVCEIGKEEFKDAKLKDVDKENLKELCSICLCEQQTDGSVGEECATAADIENVISGYTVTANTISKDKVAKIIDGFLDKCESEFGVCDISRVRAKIDGDFECSCKGFECLDVVKSNGNVRNVLITGLLIVFMVVMQ